MTITCPFCKRETDVGGISSTDIIRWKVDGELIQNVWPDMPLHTRETMISGLCEDCQKKFFK